MTADEFLQHPAAAGGARTYGDGIVTAPPAAGLGSAPGRGSRS